MMILILIMVVKNDHDIPYNYFLPRDNISCKEQYKTFSQLNLLTSWTSTAEKGVYSVTNYTTRKMCFPGNWVSVTTHSTKHYWGRIEIDT